MRVGARGIVSGGVLRSGVSDRVSASGIYASAEHLADDADNFADNSTID